MKVIREINGAQVVWVQKKDLLFCIKAHQTEVVGAGFNQGDYILTNLSDNPNEFIKIMSSRLAEYFTKATFILDVSNLSEIRIFEIPYSIKAYQMTYNEYSKDAELAFSYGQKKAGTQLLNLRADIDWLIKDYNLLHDFLDYKVNLDIPD